MVADKVAEKFKMFQNDVYQAGNVLKRSVLGRSCLMRSVPDVSSKLCKFIHWKNGYFDSHNNSKGFQGRRICTMPLWWFAFCLYIYILLQLLTAFDENAAESISISEFQIFPLISIFIFSEVSSIMVGPDLSGKPKYQFGNMSFELCVELLIFKL